MQDKYGLLNLSTTQATWKIWDVVRYYLEAHCSDGLFSSVTFTSRDIFDFAFSDADNAENIGSWNKVTRRLSKYAEEDLLHIVGAEVIGDTKGFRSRAYRLNPTFEKNVMKLNYGQALRRA